MSNNTVFVDICLDFDGVIHSYTSGWQGTDIIHDPPVHGAIETLHHYLNNFSLAVFSARSAQPGGIEAMKRFIDKHDSRQGNIRLINKIAFPDHKPAAQVYIDDRGYRFDGTFPSPAKLRKLFTPWYHQGIGTGINDEEQTLASVNAEGWKDEFPNVEEVWESEGFSQKER